MRGQLTLGRDVFINNKTCGEHDDSGKTSEGRVVVLPHAGFVIDSVGGLLSIISMSLSSW